MTDILTDLWTNFSMPEAWGLARLATLFKNKGSKKDPNMYRGLSISSSPCKLAVCIILQRQSKWYEAQLSGPQQGFRSNSDTQDVTFTVKSIGSWTKLETDIGLRQWTKPRDSSRKTVKIESFFAIYYFF